jgi:tetratricopeptide (TPR) repeat protein
VLNTLAIACAWNGKTDEALRYGGRAMELAPMEAVYVGNHGYALADAGQLAEGENLMRKALAMNPILVYLHERLGRLYLETGRKEEAEAVLSRGAELIQLGEIAGETRENLATAALLYRHLGQTDQAKAAEIRQAAMKRQEIVGGDENRIIACYQDEGARIP